MNGFQLAILVPLLLLSITREEVSAKVVKCYVMGTGNVYIKDCEGNDVVCITAVKKDDENTAIYKVCGERNEAISTCKSYAQVFNGKCKDPCETDLCNDEFLLYNNNGR